jgi:AcrR family transcriptional regulator
MPKEVDHDERREQLLEAVWTVVARDGLEGATVRVIAKETGWSSGVLAHYFADKDEIIESALALAYERIAHRWDEKLEGKSGIAALQELVLDNLPLDDQRELETKFLMNYWSRAIREGERVPRPRRRGAELIDRLRELAAQGQAAGEIVAEDDPEDIAERLLGLIDGFSLHTLLDPQRLTRARQVQLVQQELDRLSTAPSRSRKRRATPTTKKRNKPNA